MFHTHHDENGVPTVRDAMFRKGLQNNWHIVHIVFRESVSGDPEDSVLALLPFVPRQGEELLDMRSNKWTVDTVQYRALLAELEDGSKAVFYQPTVVASRRAPTNS